MIVCYGFISNVYGKDESIYQYWLLYTGCHKSQINESFLWGKNSIKNESQTFLSWWVDEYNINHSNEKKFCIEIINK